MNVCLIALGLALGCPEPPAQPERADAWLAEDKLRHFATSFAATAMIHGGARTVMDPDPALVTAAATTVALGVAKEIVDVRGGRWFSLKDLTWDLAGVALGMVVAHQSR